MVDASIAKRLDVARKELLELGLRNTLLNYRLTKARGAEVNGAKAEEVFQWLVRDGRKLSFLHTAAVVEWRVAGEWPPALPTSHEEKPLQSRLLATYYAARTHLEERGVNILFIAVGMLHWYEEDTSDRELRAPLLLIPVELERTSASEKFTVRYDEEDVEGNISLREKLRGDFGIDLPEFPDVEELDLNDYVDAIEGEIRGQKRWRIERDEVALGFFSFSKFLMYKDLEPSNWCDKDNPDASPLIAGLLRDGFEADAGGVSEDQYLDELIAPDVLNQVTDVDGSQALAMLDVRGGRNLVVQGPPGTGKSQTITNLIADALGQGKRVLFVAEKMTALEVVKRRLDKVHLGDACLELHSHSANKKAVLAELKRTVLLGRPEKGPSRWSLNQYRRARDQLNDYCSALNMPLTPSGWTPHQVNGELLAVQRVRGSDTFPRAPVGDAANSEIRTWDRSALSSKQELVERLQAHLAHMGVPSTHPFRYSRVRSVLPSDLEAIAQAARDALAAQRTLDETARDLATFMGIAILRTRADAELLARAARRALSAPHLTGLDLRTRDWIEKLDDIRHVLAAGTRFAAIHGEYDTILIPEAWTQDLLVTRKVLNTTGRKWWRWLSSEYRAARRSVAGLCRGEYRKDVETQLAIVDNVMEASRLSAAISEHEAWLGRLFGVQWQGLRSDWPVLGRLTEWVVELYRDLGDGRLPPGIIDFLAGTPSLDSLKSRVNALEAALPVCDRSLPILFDQLDVETSARQVVATMLLNEQIQMLQAMLDRLEEIHNVVRLNNLKAALEKEGLDWVFGMAWDWPEAARKLVPCFRSACLEPLLRQAHDEREPLRTANGVTHSGTCDLFRKLDVMSLEVAQHDLATKHHDGLPRMTGHGQVGILSREFEKRSRHLPLRKLIQQAGNAIQAIKPVFMMSPMSVAAFVPPGSMTFDLVIFDEASQVKPVDAFGAILRGGQVVVVGDSKQLPPTSFFDSLVGGEDLGEEDEENVTAEIESILGLASARGIPQRMLRWHYRSRHDSLIALSNLEFYDNRLVVFPSPEPRGRGTGLMFHHLPKTSYDRGGSRTNRKEAEVVARAVMAHAKSKPHLTLGVAAFSLPQADAIRDQLETLRRADPTAETFFADHPHEPFFVKNLESVQGDERDVIFISVGYGRSDEGYIAMNFGALNGYGGERRLNVLMTRARSCCEVFSNITHDDIDLTRTPARGVAVLKAFLKYAQTGIADVPDFGGEEGDSPFEHEVAQALREAGQHVVMQVGSGGFRIDLAVRDPEKQGRYLLGIECDGATYHSSRSARDRDRLRQQVLTNLGWNIHRIWSTDWFQNPRQELKRVLAAIEQAKVSSRNVQTALALSQAQDFGSRELARAPSEEELEVLDLRADPYKMASIRIRLDGKELHEVSSSKLSDWIRDIVKVESPVHQDEVMRRIAEAAGVQRVGSRIASALESAISVAQRAKVIRKKGDFLWVPDMQLPPVRDRSEMGTASRKIELIAPEEIAAAIHQVVDASYGIDLNAIPAAACRLLGFARTSDDMYAVVRRITMKLSETGRLVIEEGHVTPGDSPTQQ